MSEQPPGVRAIDFEWVDLDAMPMQYINQIVSQLGVPAGDPAVPDSVQLTFGTASQPVILGTPEQIEKKAAALTSVPVRPVARLVMSRERAEELLRILAQTLATYDSVLKGAEHARS